MQWKLILLSFEQSTLGTTLGSAYVNAHKSEAVNVPIEISDIFDTGFTKGIDFVVYKDKTYDMLKNYFFVDEKTVYTVCTESRRGCDVLDDVLDLD